MKREGECPECKIPLDPGRHEFCPKCGAKTRGTAAREILEVDVAHSGESWEDAREKIIRAVDRGVLHGHRGVKIIHGWGATTGHSSIQERAVRLLGQLARTTGGKLVRDKQNSGAHILWLNR